MAIPDPVRRDWPADRAVLLIHGIGNAREGDYAPLEAQLAALLTQAKKPYAIYTLYYDYLNDWFAGKEQVFDLDQIFRRELRKRVPVTRTWSSAVDLIGDIVWPVLLADARDAVQMAIRRQLLAMIEDGGKRVKDVADMHISIIAHSMGCFHTFETLHGIAKDRLSGLGPATNGFTLDNVMFMASPVQMIGTIANAIRHVVPRSSSLSCVAAKLAMPTQTDAAGQVLDCVRRPVSITGTLDPVGGYVFRDRWDWAYMNLDGVPDAQKIEDPQTPLNIASTEDLETIIAKSLQDHSRPEIGERHPHSWSGYIERNRKQVLEWLDVP